MSGSVGDALNAGIVANLIGLLTVTGWMAAQAYPPTRAVRLRNALLARRAIASEFSWQPPVMPDYFQQERVAPTSLFIDAAAQIEVRSSADDWIRALHIAGCLARYARDRGPIRADLAATYAQIQEGYGYCADFVKVFLGLSHAAGICARQWAFSFDGFGGHGHTVVEIFDRRRRKWLFLDVYNNIHACEPGTGEPLGALEFRDALLEVGRPFKVVPNGPGRLGYPIEARLLEYYRRGLQQWYMICGNAVFTYEGHPMVRWTSRWSGSLAQVVATILRVHPPIRVLAVHDNEHAVSALIALGRRFRIALAVFGLLALLFVMQAVSSALA